MSELILRTALVWLGLLVLLRLSGRRTLGEMSAVDLIVLLVIGDIVQQALTSGDQSLAGGFVVVCTLLLLNVGYAFLNQWLPRAVQALEGTPTLLVADGSPVEGNLRRSRVALDDVLAAGRRIGVADLPGIRYAVLELDGTINVIPADTASAGAPVIPGGSDQAPPR